MGSCARDDYIFRTAITCIILIFSSWPRYRYARWVYWLWVLTWSTYSTDWTLLLTTLIWFDIILNFLIHILNPPPNSISNTTMRWVMTEFSCMIWLLLTLRSSLCLPRKYTSPNGHTGWKGTIPIYYSIILITHRWIHITHWVHIITIIFRIHWCIFWCRSICFSSRSSSEDWLTKPWLS